MLILIDNYDSFTYNLYQLAGQYHPDVRVLRNDECSVAQVLALHPSHIILSPGPGHPDAAGICTELVQAGAAQVPILGVCLGHQAICAAFGARITQADQVVHGKADDIHIAAGNALFRGLGPLLRAGRYHSLCVEPLSLPDELAVIAESSTGAVMGVKHRDYPTFGVQFHPESILTPSGAQIISNFCQMGESND